MCGMGWRIGSLALAAAALTGTTTARAQGATDPLDAEAGGLIDKLWDSHLLRCGTSAFEVLNGRVVIEMDQPQYHLAPTRLKAAAQQNGYQYQTTAIASARRWRWAPLAGSRALRWTPWQEGQTLAVRYDETGGERGQTVVQGAVLQFDLVRKDGVWKANRPLSPLNSEIVAVNPSAAKPAVGPSCDRLLGKSF
jgi:hypothetical protein